MDIWLLIAVWVISMILGTMLRSTPGCLWTIFLGPIGLIISLFMHNSLHHDYVDQKNIDHAIQLIAGEEEDNIELVGESYYQTNIKKALGLDGGKSYKSFKVLLVCEWDNKYDENAVAAFINGKKVGYLSKNKQRHIEHYLKI